LEGYGINDSSSEFWRLYFYFEEMELFKTFIYLGEGGKGIARISS
jgi:hypothetical protein